MSLKTTQPIRRKCGETREAVYEFIQSFYGEYGFPPTLREIGDALGLSSSGTVSMHLRRLEEEKRIERYSYHARAIRLKVGKGGTKE